MAIKDIRNEVMHFDPDGISEENLEMLRKFAKFLTRLSDLIKKTDKKTGDGIPIEKTGTAS